jgi:hypothetical protein
MIEPEIGDIVRITRFGSWFSEAPGVLWAHCVGSDYYDGRPLRPELMLLAAEGEALNALPPEDPDWRETWPLDESDEWTVVPEDDVPDWVWAASALRELTQ